MFKRVSQILFTIGLCIGIVHALGLYDSMDTGPDRLGYISVLAAVIGAAIAQYVSLMSYQDKAEEMRAQAEELTELIARAELSADLSSLQDCVLRSEFVLRPPLRRNLEELDVPA